MDHSSKRLETIDERRRPRFFFAAPTDAVADEDSPSPTNRYRDYGMSTDSSVDISIAGDKRASSSPTHKSSRDGRGDVARLLYAILFLVSAITVALLAVSVYAYTWLNRNADAISGVLQAGEAIPAIQQDLNDALDKLENKLGSFPSFG